MPRMFYKYSGEKIVGYRFGDSSRAMALLVDGGYPTEEEAVLAWYRERKRQYVPESDKSVPQGLCSGSAET